MRFVSLLFVLLAAACTHPFPKGALKGSVEPEPVANWGFSDAVKVVRVETRPGDPYSFDIWGVSSGESFYIASQSWR